MKKYILLISFLLSITIANAQSFKAEMPQISPISPNASSLAVYADYPVSHYTGVPNINIPLYEVTVGDFKFPINLSYHASGIRVSDEASWVGLGWALSAGGVISRSIKCSDDFAEFYSHAGITQGYYKGPEANPYDKRYYENKYPYSFKLIIDSEPDIFYYSLPGASGKFIIDKTRGAVLFDKSNNVKIDVIQEKDETYFIITTPDGTQYVYKDRVITDSYSSEGGLNENSTNANRRLDDRVTDYLNSPMKYTSSWYLTKIITTTKREIEFSYVPETFQSPTQESSVKYNILKSYATVGSIPGMMIKDTEYSRSKQVHESIRLSKITWDSGYITFISSPREDMIGTNYKLSPEKLTSINIYDKSDIYMKGYEFVYSYFNNEYTGAYKYVYKRLKLDNLKEIDRNKKPVSAGYVFNYFEGGMPAKNSKNTDYWGFHNGKVYGSEFYVGAYHQGKIYTGADKSSNFNYLKIGTLNQIKYPTGGSAQFIYEENEFITSYFNQNIPSKPENDTKYMGVYNYYKESSLEHLPPTGLYTFEVLGTTEITITGNLENFTCGFKDPDYYYRNSIDSPIGRLRKISPNKKTLYSYETPYLFSRLTKPTDVSERGEGCEHVYDERLFTLDAGVYEFEAYKPPKDVFAGWGIKKRAVVNPPTPTNVNHKGGGLRIKQIKTESKTREFTYSPGKLLIQPVLSYNVQFDHKADDQVFYSVINLVQVSESTIPLSSLRNGNSVGYNWVSESVTDGINTSTTTYEFHNEIEEPFNEEYPFTPTYIDSENGLPDKVTLYSNDNVVQETKYSYRLHYNRPPVQGFIHIGPLKEYYGYNYSIGWLKEKNEYITTKGVNTAADIIDEKNTSFNDYYQLNSQDYFVKNTPYRNVTKYSSDYTDNISTSMVNKYQVGIPVESYIDKDDYIIKGKKIIYKDTLGMILPGIVSTIKTKEPIPTGNQAAYYTPEIYFEIYNTYGRIVQLSDNNYRTVYIWSYNGEYPIAEIKNASYAQVRDILGGEAYINELAKQYEPTYADWQKIESLRGNAKLKNSMITVYKYRPLAGVKEIIDPKGIITYYGYDDFWRLKEIYMIENAKKKVIQTFTYHYQNQ